MERLHSHCGGGSRQVHSHCGRTAAASAAAPFALRWLPWSRSDGCLGRGATVCLSRSSEGSRQVHSHCGGEGSNKLPHCGGSALRRLPAMVCLCRSSKGSEHCSGEGSNQLHSHCGGCLGCGSCGLSEQVE